MAARDHKDLPSQTQDLSFSLLNHFLNCTSPWYIKDEQSRYVIANQAVLKLYGIDGHDLYGHTDKELDILTSCFQNFNLDSERLVRSDSQERSALILNYFNGDINLSPRVFTVQPFYFGKLMTVTFVSAISAINVNEVMESLINQYIDMVKTPLLSLDRPLSEYAYINPLTDERLTEKQWEVAWLVLLGFSYRKISKLKKIAPKNVCALLSKAFENLGVYSLNEFLFVGKHHSWLDYIPPSILNTPSATIISIHKFSKNNQKQGVQVLPFTF